MANNYIVGFLHREAAIERIRLRSGLTDGQWRQRLKRLVAQTAGTNTYLADEMVVRQNLHRDNSFSFGLERVLDGIAALIE